MSLKKDELKTLVMKYFNLEQKTQSTENKESFAEATLVDGTKIVTMTEGDFEVGQELHVVTSEGEHVLAPSGEHTTDSGIVLTVDGEGIITGVHYPDQEGEGSLEASAEEMSSEEVTEEKTEMAEDDLIEEETLEEEGDVKEAVIEAIAEVVLPELESMKAKLAEHEEKLAKYEEKMSKVPASKPVTENKFNKAKEFKNIAVVEKPAYKQAHYQAVLSRLEN